MLVSIVKTKRKKGDYYLTLKPRLSSKREKKVVKAISLALTNLHPLIGSLPTSYGKDASLFLKAIPRPIPSDKEYKVALETHKEPPWNSAYEVQQGIMLDRKIDANIEYHKALRSNAIIKQYGLEKAIPKSARAKFTCRCGVSFKKRYKLLRHQEFCTVLAEERDNFTNIEAILAAKKVNDEGKRSKKKEKRTTRQPVPDKSSSTKRRRKKATKLSK